MTELTTTAVVVMATSLIGFLSLLITLVFLWKVYKRGGRHDLTAAARALRDTRSHRLPGTAARLTPPARRRRQTRTSATVTPTMPEQHSDQSV